MNKKQLKELEDAEAKLDLAKQIIEDIKGQLEEKLDRMSDKAKEGEKGQQLQSDIDTLENAYDSADSAQQDVAGIMSAHDEGGR